jgi:hypothetical protein
MTPQTVAGIIGIASACVGASVTLLGFMVTGVSLLLTQGDKPTIKRMRQRKMANGITTMFESVMNRMWWASAVQGALFVVSLATLSAGTFWPDTWAFPILASVGGVLLLLTAIDLLAVTVTLRSVVSTIFKDEATGSKD